MRTRREHGALLYGGSSGGGWGYGGGAGASAGASVARGTVAGDTRLDGGRMVADILVDGDSEPGAYTVDFAMKAGQRVAILMFGAQSLILPISSLILQAADESAEGKINDAKTELETSIDTKGEAIKAEAVRQATASANGEVAKGIEAFSQTVAATYTTKDEAKSFATSSDLTQTEQDITATFTKSLNEKGKTFVGKPAPPYSRGDVRVEPAEGRCYVCTTARASGSFREADWAEHDAFVSAFVRQDYEGVTVGKSQSQWKARLSTRGTFDVLDASDAVVTQVGTESAGAYMTTAKSALTMRSQAGDAVVTVGNGHVDLSSSAGARVSGGGGGVPMAAAALRGTVLGGVCLYANSSGTTGTVSLSRDVSLFTAVDIHFADDAGRLSAVRVCGNPSGSGVGRIKNGTRACLSRAVGSGAYNAAYISAEYVTLTGSAITRGDAKQANITGSGVVTVDGAHYVRAVIGWML